MRMNRFVSGMGMGFIAGSAVGMLVSPRTRSGKTTVGRTLKNMGTVIDSVTDFLR